jgi:putative membrane protein
MQFFFKLVTTTLAILITSYLLPGVEVENVVKAIILSAVLAVLNVLLKPLLLILTLPVTIVTFGLFLVVINAFVVLLAAEIVPGVVINSFWWAVLFSIILSIVVSVLESLQRSMSGDRDVHR